MRAGVLQTNIVPSRRELGSQIQKWRPAFVAIYCSRALLSLYQHSGERGFSGIDRTRLVQLVREKNLDELQKLGGVDGVALALKTSTEHGIYSSSTDGRCKAFGSNTYKKPPTKGFLYFAWEAFQDRSRIIVLVCGALALGLGMIVYGAQDGWQDGLSILFSLFLSIIVDAIFNYELNRRFDKMSKVSNSLYVDAMRDGRRKEISVFETLVGDVIHLNTGDQVPADGLFLEENCFLQVDESSITGESDHIEVNHDQNPFLFSGTNVVVGNGRMLVTSVGMNTNWGRMLSKLNRESREKTPLQNRLDRLTSSICTIGMAADALVVALLLIGYFTGKTQIIDENGNQARGLDFVLQILEIAVTIFVAALPEGLPLAVTLTLVYPLKGLMAQKAMVRKLSACETMGSATTICTDKTGTLTMNQMKVTKFWLGKDMSVEEVDCCDSIAPAVIELLREGIAVNTTASINRTTGSEYEIKGSPTEKAILSWAIESMNLNMEEVKMRCSVLHHEMFNSEKKRSGVLMKRKIADDDGTDHVHWKGAAEKVLSMCCCYRDAYGVIKVMDYNQKVQFQKIIEGMAASSLRCIAFAHSQVPAEDSDIEHKMIKEDGLVLLGLVGIKDPCRPGVKKAVEDCQNAGVNVKMITGDNIFTAKAIATECGILRPEDENREGAVIEGEEFRNYTPEERTEKVEKICVMARSSPSDKLLMVECLKEKGHVVAITGDGTNDAPALKEADIGLCMGIQGTEAAKESSDIIILDDNFSSVVTVLKWGRGVYNNVQKFIQFQLTVNISLLVFSFIAVVSGGCTPFTTVQVLWLNLIMETLGALALATGDPTKELMNKIPVERTDPFIINIMWRNILPQAAYQICLVLAFVFKGESIFHADNVLNTTLVFNTFVLYQVFNEFNARKMEKKNVFEGVHRNKIFVGIIAITIVLQVVVVEFLNNFASTERLSLQQWGICIGIASMTWPIGWVVKCLPVPEKPFLSHLITEKIVTLMKRIRIESIKCLAFVKH
ncbi:putative calcium-transporting ATPase 13, plasma membrane-type [Ziziphus jujuba]|uniref:Calcium-transporting ATPase n=1 Tax=Ziziphus jujuba TaxID=326968 RepID=A0A6P6FZS1_ZIZJJ|nr:putative calcium-transporting ATPase 13, plasma membrane-type [Ziziphus jujuba]